MWWKVSRRTRRWQVGVQVERQIQPFVVLLGVAVGQLGPLKHLHVWWEQDKQLFKCWLVSDRDLLEAPVSKVMDKGFPIVGVDDDVNQVTRKLRIHPAVLIEEYGRITGIITRHDMLDTSDGDGN